MAKNKIYQMRIDLKDSKPPIWRRIQVPGQTRLDQLHLIIQTAMTKTQFDYTQPVVQLLTLGDVRGQAEWRDYLAPGQVEEENGRYSVR